jgi:replication factor C small subunit
MQEIWTEKYRPRTLEDVSGQEAVIDRLKAYVKTRNLPHLLFAGTAGTGKTTCAIALARELFGDDQWKQNFSEMNASDERGIQIVRTKIKDFARTAPIGDVGLKIIFLDEADALTHDAQAALRRTMEKYSRTCRFILSCNYSSKIIPPIQSRCAVFRFKPLDPEAVRATIEKVAAEEGLTVTDDGFDTLNYICRGDLRRAVTALQVGASISTTINSDTLYQSTATARPEQIDELITSAYRGEFLKAREALDTLMIEFGLSGEDVVRQMHTTVYNLGIAEKDKVELIDAIGEAEYRIVQGCNERIQLEALLARIALIGSGK